MNLTLSNVKQIKQQSTNPLFKKVCQYVIDKWSEYDNKKAIFTEVLTYGCQSGIVGSLIYYSDTTNFYKRYKSEINELLYDTFKEIGSNDPAYVFGDEWDKEDPLAQEVSNQNLLAWFGFEETLRNLGYKFTSLKNEI